MENTINKVSMIFIVAAFLVGGTCGYQYHSYADEQQVKHFLGTDNKAGAKKVQGFFDYKPDTK